MEIFKVCKPGALQRSLSRSTKKFDELWYTNYGDLEVQLYPQNRLFRQTIFRPLGGAARATEWPSLASPYPKGDGGSPNNFFNGSQKLA